jgi:uncharacterized delta-60 repeat protein
MRNLRLFATALTCACLVHAQGVRARGGDPDSTFGTNGVAALRTAGGTIAYQMAPGINGTTIAVRTSAGSMDVQRFLDNGRLDTSFGGTGTVTLAAQALIQGAVVQSDGKIVLGGPLFSGAGWGFTRIGTNGVQDPSFGTAGWSLLPGSTAAGAQGMSLHVLDDGRISAIAYPTDQVGPPAAGHATAFRLLTNGQPDAAYGAGGVVDHAFAFAWSPEAVASEHVLGDGTMDFARIVTGGVGVSRLRPDGTLDPAFGSGTTRTTFLPFAVTPDVSPVPIFRSDGSLFVASILFDAPTAQSILKLALVAPRGSLDPSFGTLGVITVRALAGALTTILATPDDELVIVTTDGFSVLAEKLTTDGVVDARFGNGGKAAVAGYTTVDAFMAVDGFVTVLAQKTSGLRDGALIRMQAVGDIVEFSNSILDHYFIALDGAEAAGIDNGAAGPGWSRTKVAMRPGGLASVCRFYGTPGIGPNSHFYTAQPAECALVKKDPGWTLEGIGFYTTRVVDAACNAPLVPVYRYYNNRAQYNDSNHRYVTDVGLRGYMESLGWVLEGIVFCVKP